jgi:hypothetical protein
MSIDQIVQFSFISLIINIVSVNTTVLKKIKLTHSSSMAKLSILAILAIPTILTISMHGNVLAASEPGYQLTVNIPSYPSTTSTVGMSITTANGYTDHANVATSGTMSWTFKIPSNQGSWVRVCVNSDSSSGENCNTYNTAGSDMSVSLSPPSGDTYYVYPGNTYYIYPGDSYGYYVHHHGDHGYVGHPDSGNVGYGGHQDSGNHGVGGYVGHPDSGNVGYGGHQDSGNHGVTEPTDHLHHLSNGEPMMNESSDDN